MNRIAVISIAATALVAGLMYAAIHRPRPANQSDAFAAAGFLAGKFAPDFALHSLDGSEIRLSDFRGRPVLLNFWATWCAPCRIEMPWLAELYSAYHAKGLEVIGISLDDPGQQDAVRKFVREKGVNYTILFGTNSVADTYGGVRLMPQIFYISPGGLITNSSIGITSKADLDSYIRRLLAAH